MALHRYLIISQGGRHSYVSDRSTPLSIIKTGRLRSTAKLTAKLTAKSILPQRWSLCVADGVSLPGYWTETVQRRSLSAPSRGGHTGHLTSESTIGTTSFLAICSKTKLTTGTSCFFYKKGLCVVLAAQQQKLHPSTSSLLGGFMGSRVIG